MQEDHKEVTVSYKYKTESYAPVVGGKETSFRATNPDVALLIGIISKYTDLNDVPHATKHIVRMLRIGGEWEE